MHRLTWSPVFLITDYQQGLCGCYVLWGVSVRSKGSTRAATGLVPHAYYGLRAVLVLRVAGRTRAAGCALYVSYGLCAVRVLQVACHGMRAVSVLLVACRTRAAF